MHTTIHLRQYSPKDLAQTVRLWRASRRDAFPYVEVQQRSTLAEDMAYFRAIVAVECVVWLAEVEGHLAGLLAIKDDYIDQLFVAVEWQRQGVGTALERIVVTAPCLAIQRVPGSALGRRPARISWEGGCLRLPLWQARVLAFLTYVCTLRRQRMTDKAQPPTAMATTGTRHRVRSLERDYAQSGEP